MAPTAIMGTSGMFKVDCEGVVTTVQIGTLKSPGGGGGGEINFQGGRISPPPLPRTNPVSCYVRKLILESVQKSGI